MFRKRALAEGPLSLYPSTISGTSREVPAMQIHEPHQRRDERGASLVEYALLIALIAAVCIVAITFLGGRVSSNYSSNASAVSAAGS
jgi:pilus assembly protein Flp/PilA